jgi:hypothetical protein
MIIDAHCHISNETWNPQWWWDTLNTNVSSRYGHTPAQSAELRKKSWDPSGTIGGDCISPAASIRDGKMH